MNLTGRSKETKQNLVYYGGTCVFYCPPHSKTVWADMNYYGYFYMLSFLGVDAILCF